MCPLAARVFAYTRSSAPLAAAPAVLPEPSVPLAMSQAPIPDADVQLEVGGLNKHPVTEDERRTACRAIMRFKGKKAEEEESPIEVTEDWVRLYVALRRASGSPSVRFSANHLRRWRARACRNPRL